MIPAPKFIKGYNQLFVDLDGVMADFDKRFEELSGHSPRDYEDKHGRKAFWKVVNSVDDFFLSLPPMEDAHILYDAIKDAGPTFLTGGLDGDTYHVTKEQKEMWVDAQFPGHDIIVCLSKNKSLHMKPGDVIVDDWTKYKHIWEEKGGHWVLHTDAHSSIAELQRLGVI